MMDISCWTMSYFHNNRLIISIIIWIFEADHNDTFVCFSDNRKVSDSNTAARARRAQLIEAECMVLHLKKETNKKDGIVILEAQNKKIASSVDKIVNELKQMTLKQHKETFLGLTNKRLGLHSFGNTVSQAR